jgi:hypothetical protein
MGAESGASVFFGSRSEMYGCVLQREIRESRLRGDVILRLQASPPRALTIGALVQVHAWQVGKHTVAT